MVLHQAGNVAVVLKNENCLTQTALPSHSGMNLAKPRLAQSARPNAKGL
jgi:hypothetical protein